MKELVPIDTRELRAIRGTNPIFDWYGAWPTFHDSYLLDVHFSIWQSSYIRLHVYKSFDRSSDSEGVVTMYLGRLFSKEIVWAPEQLLGVTIYQRDEIYRVVIEGSLSAGGVIETDSIWFAFARWPPEAFDGRPVP
jgi:hypothetical protein